MIKAFTDNIITPDRRTLAVALRERPGVGRQRPTDRLRRLHLCDRLLRDLHGGDVLPDRRALPGVHEKARHHGVRRARRQPRRARPALATGVPVAATKCMLLHERASHLELEGLPQLRLGTRQRGTRPVRSPVSGSSGDG